MFDQDAVVSLVSAFCRHRGVDHDTRYRVVPSLAEALRIAYLKGPDRRWKTINVRGDAGDFPEPDHVVEMSEADRSLSEFLLRVAREDVAPRDQRGSRDWFLSYIVIAAAHWARVSQSMRQARADGLGWVVPARREVLIVPRPEVRYAEGQPGVFHDDTGRRAIEWPDDTGHYFLRGTEFDQRLYFKVIGAQLLIQDIAALRNVDERAIALQYLTFEQLVTDCNADLLDTGIRGTRLFRLPLPPRLAADRARGYGKYDYFIHMRDASHPEREFIEWVDPQIGVRRDAELCQAHAFGITLQQWLSVEQEG